MGEAEAQDWEAVRPGVKCLQECEDFLEERASWRGAGTTPGASRTGGTPEGISGLALESPWLQPGCRGMKAGAPPPCQPLSPPGFPHSRPGPVITAPEVGQPLDVQVERDGLGLASIDLVSVEKEPATMPLLLRGEPG